MWNFYHTFQIVKIHRFKFAEESIGPDRIRIYDEQHQGAKNSIKRKIEYVAAVVICLESTFAVYCLFVTIY